ncbi:MAG: arginase [Alphaproteobacteria bacterium]|nr:arginase [Alphaproteobacteria bacterium]
MHSFILFDKIKVMNYIQTSIIGAASGWGAQKRTTEHGPDAVAYFDIIGQLSRQNYHVRWKETIHPDQRFANDKSPARAQCLPMVARMCEQVYKSTLQTLHTGSRPCVIGGDHSIAIGTWSALAAFEQGDIGLIWFDAHMDSHTPETSPSQAIHGMSVAALMGYGNSALTGIGQAQAKLKPENVVLIGIRDFEDAEEKRLQQLGVKIFYMKDIHQAGFESALLQAINIVTARTNSFGLSIDLDGFDPEEAPGVGSPAPGGLTADQVLPYLHHLRTHPKFKAFEIMEYNPHLDINNKTIKLIHNILKNLLDRE